MAETERIHDDNTSRRRTAVDRTHDRSQGAPEHSVSNSLVQRLLRSTGVMRKDRMAGATVDDDLARSIQARRGGGAPLEPSTRRDLEPAMGDDFTDVRVHTDADADRMNRAVQAEAFTTGSDIFFRQGAYNPTSSDGRKLLAHELTHVVQQRSAPAGGGMRVSSPDDATEREASTAAERLAAPSAPPVIAREPEDDEMARAPEEDELAREPEEEELAREAAPEDELEAPPSLDRDASMEEEEPADAAGIGRQEALDDESENGG
jgi:hypothetical protein